MKHILAIIFVFSIALTGCKPAESTTKAKTFSSGNLEGQKWILLTLNGDPINLTDSELETPYLNLNPEDHSLGGYSGCNTFGGKYIQGENQQLEFSDVIATMRHCKGHGIERMFMTNLDKTKSYILHDNLLTLQDENGYELITFSPYND